MSVIHYSTLQKHKKSLKLPSAQTQIAYADRVSPDLVLLNIFLIVTHSTFQSHCRALAMCRDIFSFFLFHVSHNR